MTSENSFAIYHVGLKVLLRRGDEFLFLTSSDGKFFDLPGGRINEREHRVPLTAVLAREIREELGEHVTYRLGNPLFQFRRHFDANGFHVFLTVYAADVISGDIRLSDEHNQYKWMKPDEVIAQKNMFFSDEEYEAFSKYFETLRQA